MIAYTKAKEDLNYKLSSVIGWLLVASYLYYHRHRSLFEDDQFDELCTIARDNWDSITHTLKHLVTLEDLNAGTMYAIKESEYPNGLKRFAEAIYRDQEAYNNSNSLKTYAAVEKKPTKQPPPPTVKKRVTVDDFFG